MDLSPERWAEIDAVLDEAFDRDPDNPAAVLADICDDPDLREDVRAFLDADEGAVDFLEDDAALHAGSLFPDDLNTEEMEGQLAGDIAEALNVATDAANGGIEPGTTLGPFEVKSVIGRGGMSTVYRATRVDGSFDQDVAIKLMRPLSDPSAADRFRAERQILASLHHPNVAQVFDGGTTPDGRPYLVMEYVDGQPITSYCDDRQLSLEERIELFGDVIEAVQHAHQNLIIHRDLKPTNILVTEDGTLKLLDFGIAKVLEASAHRDRVNAPATRTGMHLMTPEYAAPEQVRGETVTTSTDVYALGILLYELLTGHRPYKIGKGSTYEIVQAVCEQDPTRPSTAVMETKEMGPPGATHAITPDAVSKARRTDPDQLRQTLRGDLDAIILKALRKEPDARYRTADSFADDLRRFQQDQPVDARTITLGYQVQKLVQRNRAAVIGAAAVLLLLVGYALTITYQANRIAAERDKAEAVASFITSIFADSDPMSVGNTPELTVRELVDRGAERIRSDLAEQPLVRAQVEEVLGRVYSNLGLYEQSTAMLTDALTTRQGHPDASAYEIARVETSYGYTLFRQARYAKGDSLLQRALRRIEQTYGERDVRTIDARHTRALLLEEWGKREQAEALYRLNIDIREDNGSVDPGMYHDLASALQSQGKYEEALRNHRLANDGFREEYGASPQLANGLTRTALTHHRAGNNQQAEAMYREGLKMRREMLPDYHPHIASSCIRLGWLLAETGRPQEAEPLVDEGISILQRLLPPNHWQIAIAKGIRGFAWAQQGRVAEAIPPIQNSFQTLHAEFGPNDWRTQSTGQVLAQILAKTGQTDAAQEVQRMLQG
jgi:eukaryotic-like serine/threonine-protein kinase